MRRSATCQKFGKGKFPVWTIVLFILAGGVSCREARGPHSPGTGVEALIEELRLNPWKGPESLGNPTHWSFNFTDPMQKILAIGPPAQQDLLRHLDDVAIKDQIIILIGGVGNGSCIEPIINAMAGKDEINLHPGLKKINLDANLALTNITAAEVIWGRGGGISFDACPDDPKLCWSDWWEKNKDHLRQATAVARNYSNYPNYGIYAIRDNH